MIDRNSTGYKLFKSVFHCRVKAKHLVRLPDGDDPTGLLVRAMPTTGDYEFDQHLAESLNDVYLPPSDIAELISEGADVLIVNRADVKKIYNIIQDHLVWWSNRLREGYLKIPGKSEEITRDLRVLSDCADRLYPMVMEYQNKDAPPTERAIMEMNTVNSYSERITHTESPHRPFDDLFDPSVLKRVHSWEQ